MKHNEVKHETKKATLKVAIASLFVAGVLLSATPAFAGNVSVTAPTVSTETDSKVAYGCWPKSWKSVDTFSNESNLSVKNNSFSYFRNYVCSPTGERARSI